MAEITVDDDAVEALSQREAAKLVGLSYVEWDRAEEAGLVPAPDVAGRRWSVPLLEALAGKGEELVEQLGPPPVGATRAAEELAGRLELPVVGADVELLAERGLVARRGEYQGWPLYDRRDLAAVSTEAVAEVIAEREAWRAGTCNSWEAAERLEMRRRDFDRAVAPRLTEVGNGRWSRAEIEALRVNEDLAADVDREQLLGPEQAAARLEVRRVDWDYVVAAGWITPQEWISVRVGVVRHVEVPLFRAGDIDDLRDRPEVNWDDVRAVRPGEASPLRRFAILAPSRGRLVHRWIAQMAARWDTEIWGVYRGAWDHWEIDWLPGSGGHPTSAELAQALDDDPDLAEHRDSIEIGTEAGAAVRWARAMLAPDTAVILDTETTDLWDGSVIELAVIDTDGTVLIDTLVNPGRPIQPGAQGVHGISDDELVDAPTWPEVLPKLLAATHERQILAYHSDFDLEVILADCARHGLDPIHLGDASRWDCIMSRRSDWARTRRPHSLDGPHGALGDALAALDVVRRLATPRP
jgi:DNA polymerase III epsilon subunit-like protein